MSVAVRAILFDIDGTLVDSTPAVERTWRIWSDRYGIDPDAVLAVCHGRRSEDTVGDLIPTEPRAQAVRDLDEIELGDLDDVIALPGAPDLLASLPQERWAAVTSGGRQLMTARLRAAGLPIPTVFVTAGDVTVGKPDPEGYLLAARALGFTPSDCLVVEDAPAGAAAGRRAGARVLGLETSHRLSELGHLDLAAADLSAVSVSRNGDLLQVDVRHRGPARFSTLR
ncbi:sugar-phosphatase [Okibacterium sp. HSC-33S16]|uniref:HAD-IA family hydrolase n=1 Tax=Okibacterium sp. HSC-33S16 TaxID=2910965 RepID=UPI00209C9A89|nr:HAD-IA family hydrolase [Okibacterium sp. HSC-33S16]MCP2031188.1 sugar-phosphatase [Okibacterium sp. HSC-33S16]